MNPRQSPIFRIQSGSKLLLIGDSVTDCERARPIGEGLFGAWGNGYVRDVATHLGVAYPLQRIRVVNMGASGNTVRDLKQRWQTDVIDLKPDWLSIMIGINDVWRQFDSPLEPEKGVPLDEYEATLDQIISQIRQSLAGLVLMTPFYIEPLTEDAMRAKMDLYGAAVKRLAEKHEAVFVDTQAAFDVALTHSHSANLAWDRIHPNATGHLVIAKAFLDAIGFEWSPSASNECTTE